MHYVLNGAKYFYSDGLQNYSVFVSATCIIRLVKSVAIVKLDHVGGMSQNSIKNLHTSYISFTPKLIGDY